MIINIRGTNGSGKSTIIKRFLQQYPYIELYGALGPRRPEAYKLRLPGNWLYIIGPYQTTTGGVDAMGLSAIELIALLDKYRKLGHVIFEGVVISTYYGAIGEWLKTHADEAIVVFLDTPLEVCLAGIKARGGKNMKNVAAKMPAIERLMVRMTLEGITNSSLSREMAYETIRGWLK